MNALEICGIIFLSEVGVIVLTVAISITKGIAERHEKKVTYKKIMEMEKDIAQAKKNNPKPEETCDPEDEKLTNEIKNNPDSLNKVLENAVSEESDVK